MLDREIDRRVALLWGRGVVWIWGDNGVEVGGRAAVIITMIIMSDRRAGSANHRLLYVANELTISTDNNNTQTGRLFSSMSSQLEPVRESLREERLERVGCSVGLGSAHCLCPCLRCTTLGLASLSYR
jgi:hypothetical protein